MIGYWRFPAGDWTVRVHDLESRTPVGEALHGHTPGCYITVLAVAEVEGSRVVVSADTVGEIRAWDLESHLPVGGPLSGHTPGLPVFSLAVTGDGDGRCSRREAGMVLPHSGTLARAGSYGARIAGGISPTAGRL